MAFTGPGCGVAPKFSRTIPTENIGSGGAGGSGGMLTMGGGGVGGAGAGGGLPDAGGGQGGGGAAAAGGSGDAGGNLGGSLGGSAGAARGGAGGGIGGNPGAPGSGGSAGSSSGGSGSGGAAGSSAIISIDFVGGGVFGGPPGPTPMAATEIAGVKPVSHWNSAAGGAGTLRPLSLASGATVPASAIWGAQTSVPIYRVGIPDIAGDSRMMNGYLDPMGANSPATVTVMDLPSFITANGYDVYVYCLGSIAAGQMRTYRYSIGTTTFTVLQSGPSPTIFTGYMLASNAGPGNYIVFRKVTGPSFTLTAQPVAGPTPQDFQRAPLNGLQIVWPSEP